ncbi:MAG: DUF1206 domain-containing protein [Acidimicrobiales bacterium]
MTSARNLVGAGVGTDPVVRMGRVALATQGILYVIVGFLAVQVAGGDRSAKPSQKGAIANLAHQPYGRILVGLLAVGLLMYFGWRLMLAIRGEPGDDEDGGSLAKRAANLGRGAIYASFAVVAFKLAFGSEGSGGSSGSGGGQSQQKSTATVLSWPGGRVLVVVAGLCVIGAGLWNAYKAVTSKFEDNLDLSSLDHKQAQAVKVIGTGGYLARGVAFALIGWFLIHAGFDKNAGETKGLDGALRSLADSGNGRLALVAVGLGLVLFGAFRVLDGVYRRPSEIANS